MDYVCKTKCFFQKRIWERGEEIKFAEKMDKKLIPHHFVPKSKFVKDIQLTRKEQDLRAAEAVGHGSLSSKDDDILS